MYDETVTVFNRKRTESGDVWYPTVVEGVHIAACAAGKNGRYGTETGDAVTVLIPYERTAAGPSVGGKPYLPSKAWQQAEEPGAAVTFSAGEGFDFFLRGLWEGAPVQDGDWPEGFYAHMERAHDGVYAVSSVRRYGALPHFEIGGR